MIATASGLKVAYLATNGISVKEHIDRTIDDLLSSLPDPEDLSADERRGIIARYTAVLEGNFIYWMTAAYLSARSEEARSIISENLHEEIRDCHPGMMRRFAVSADAAPNASDALAVYSDLTNVRLFVGRLSSAPILLMMAFFEGFLQQFMAYLADLADRQGSTEQEYTIVHGVCDVAHAEGLFHALAAEMAINPPEPGSNLFEGVDLLQALMRNIVSSDRAVVRKTELADQFLQ